MKPRGRARAEAPGARFEPRAIYDGRERIGTVLPSVAGFLAKDAAGRTLGGFPTAQEAVRAIVAATRKA